MLLFFFPHSPDDDCPFFVFIGADIEDSLKHALLPGTTLRLVLDRLPTEIECRALVRRNKSHSDLEFEVNLGTVKLRLSAPAIKANLTTPSLYLLGLSVHCIVPLVAQKRIR